MAKYMGIKYVCILMPCLTLDLFNLERFALIVKVKLNSSVIRAVLSVGQINSYAIMLLDMSPRCMYIYFQ